MMSPKIITLLLLVSSLVSLIEGAPVVDTEIKESCNHALNTGLKFWSSAGGGVRHFRKRPIPSKPLEDRPKIVEEISKAEPLKLDVVNTGPVNDVESKARVDGEPKMEPVSESSLLADYYLTDNNNKEVRDEPLIGNTLKDDYHLNDIKAVEAKPESASQKHEVDLDAKEELIIMPSNKKENEQLLKPAEVRAVEKLTKAPEEDNYDVNLIGLASISHLLRNGKQ